MTDKMPIPVDLLTAPIYFDGVTNQGFNNGIANIVLVANRFRPDGGDGITRQVIVTADLRCTIGALIALKAACEAALLLAVPKPTDDSAKN